MTEYKKKSICFGWDVLILLFFVGLALVVRWRAFDYLSGTTNLAIEKGLPFGRLLLYAITGLLLMSCIFIMIARIVYQWKAVPLWGNIVRICLAVLMFAGIINAFGSGVPGIDRFSQEFTERMRATADVKSIRTWSTGLAVPPDSESIPENLWPECVSVLSPNQVYVTEENGVRLDWGGGFIGHYGLVVEAENIPTPSSGTQSDIIIPLEAGAYLYFPNQ